MDELYKKAVEILKQNPSPGHDEKHALRVASLAKKIAKEEGYHPKEAEIAGLLHDVGRSTNNKDEEHAKAGVPIAKKLLDQYTSFSDDAKNRILLAVEEHSNFSTQSKLSNIIQDADKLDGMGAIGINRAYVSHSHLPDYDPKVIIPQAGEYANFKTIHDLIALEIDWYNMLYTETAKKLAKPRYEFAIKFMKEIKREIEESS